MIDLTEYCGDGPGQTVYVNPSEIAVVRNYAFHSFRPLIGEIVLRSGEKIRVWETVDQINCRIKSASGGDK